MDAASSVDDVDLVAALVREHLGDRVLHDGVGNVLDPLLLPVEGRPPEGDELDCPVVAGVVGLEHLDLEAVDGLLDGLPVDEDRSGPVGGDRLLVGAGDIPHLHLEYEVADILVHLRIGPPPDSGVVGVLLGVEVLYLYHCHHPSHPFTPLNIVAGWSPAPARDRNKCMRRTTDPGS